MKNKYVSTRIMAMVMACLLYTSSYLKDGISLGSIYAIIALGYTMVYGIAKMLNFAHGDVIMVGAYIILTCCLLYTSRCV